ncbi:hypothetical protein SAMN06265371_101324 [Lutibacter agarilyticus]|uniref:Uncharacterized protein n=1 Tax=Lutibacter agarilyticus TaxID=1109740 RepID=A0A238VHA6_9FLAO|nr:hypothetical protein [Lutibacter agarilyticus]SNR32889.1 hypothetical protein SAMN06265371_101324 [Lutibacter agarilyticus]
MDLDRIIELLSYTIPSVVTGLVAYYFFVNHTKNEQQKLKLSLLKENQKKALPIKLQAYERMTLFLERINPSNLLIRITSVNNDKNAYAVSIVNSIEQEFEHNLAQQIYISNECWNVIVASKNTTIQLITNTSKLENITNAQELREAILTKMIEVSPPSKTALAFIKNEVKDII